MNTVRSLLAQRDVLLSDVEIIVADDDPELSAREAIVGIAQDANVPIRYVRSAAQNISTCRNTCLETAKGNWIAFIDDDQIAEPDWLAAMMGTAAKFNADAVKCYVRGIYPPETPHWIKSGGAYTYDYGRTGTEVGLAATCGILFRRDLPDARKLLFDVTLGVTGGEDFEFFIRYKDLGGKIVSCRAAVANEIVPTERVNPKYLQRRYRGYGNIHGRVVFAKRSRLARSISIMKSVMGVTVTCPYSMVRGIHGALGCWMFTKFWNHFGVLEWALGRDAFYHE